MRSLQFLQLFTFALVFFTSSLIVRGFDSSNIDLGAKITKITSNKRFSDTFFYVGGENFIASVTKDLKTIFKHDIGPVHGKEYCYPQVSPCSNTVTVLELDENFNKLIVCGTAYQGTCTLHDIQDLSSYLCINFSNETDSGVVSPSSDHQVLVHFLKPTDSNELPEVVDSMEEPVNCRPEDFTDPSYLEPLAASEPYPREFDGINENETKNASNDRMKHNNTDLGNEDNTGFSNFRISRLMVASFQENRMSDIPRQPVVSLRHITGIFTGKPEMEYTGKDKQPTGIFMAPDKAPKIKADFHLSFSHKDSSYFLSVQRGLCPNEEQQCTFLSRSNDTVPSLLPYIELPLVCKHEEVFYPLLTASVLGTVGLKQASSTEEIPILILAFAKGSKGDIGKPDKEAGTAICAYALDTLDSSEFGFAKYFCASKKVVPWSGTIDDSCKLIRAERFGGDSKAIHHIPKTIITSLLTHTQTVQNTNSITWTEKMYLFVAQSEESIGFKLSKELELRVVKSASTRRPAYNVNADRVPSNAKNSFQPPNGAKMAHPPPIGIVDHTRAMMFLAYETKIFSLSLDFCRQYSTCSTCQLRGSWQCRWCPNKSTCVDKNSVRDESCSEGSCPPQLQYFEPKSVPVEGGSTLTIRGSHLGNNDSTSKVAVTICGQPCDNVFANVNSLTCTVRSKPPECGHCDLCTINVSVKENKDSHGNGSSNTQLAYVHSRLTKFKPSFGPHSKGTLLEVWGDNLAVGSKRQIEVSGVNCSIVEEDGESLMCRMEDAVDLENRCGPVTLKIDRSVIKSKDEKYCFKPDPIIQSVEPLSTIESGGINLLVKGKNLDSTRDMVLIISVGDSDKEPKEFKSECLIDVNGDSMTCITPDVRSKTKIFFNDRQDTNEIQASIEFDMREALANISSALGPFYIHRDPFLIKTETPFIHRKMKDRLFIITGINIPKWISEEEVIVKIGQTQCEVVEITEHKIRCNVSEVLRAYRRYYLKKLLTTKEPFVKTSEMSRNSFESPLTTQGSINDDNTSTATITTTSPTTMTKMTNLSTPAWDTTTETNASYSSNSTQLVGVTEDNKTGSPFIVLDALKEHTHPRRKNNIKGQKRAPLTYPLTVQIGNWKTRLGNVTVGPPPYDIEEDPDTGNSTFSFTPQLIGIIVGGVVLVFVLPLCACVIYIYQKRRENLERPFYMGSLSGKSISYTGSGEPTIPSLYQILHSVIDPSKKDAATDLIIALDQIRLGKNIGAGNFGCVYEGILTKDPSQPLKVAVKTLQEPVCHSINLTGFVQEAVIMMDFHHENVLSLVGLSEKEPGVPYVILPYMENGDLLTYIRDTKRVLHLYDVIQFGADICNGMAYLSSLKLVHRDLAARNCMLDVHYRVKVADFGLCRDIYEKGYYTSDNKKKLPIRWMAMESIESGAYSTKSDVWSMGVVMWELLTRGMTPYPGVDGWDIVNFLRRRRLEPPFFCPETLYRLMMNCWAKNPAFRPTFKALQKELLVMIGKEVVSTPATPEPTTNQQTLFQNANKSTDPTAPDRGSYLIPVIKVSQDSDKHSDDNNVSNKKESQSSQETGLNKSTLSSSVMSLPRNSLAKNVKITIPTCYEYRDIKKESVAAYLQLVDNYEPAPRFANPFLRSKKKRLHKPGKRTSKEKNSKELNVPHLSRNSGKKTNSAGYTIPADSSGQQRYVIPRTGSDGQLVDRDTLDGACFEAADAGNYYELEQNQRSSNISVLNSSCHSSMFDKTASVGSLLDRYSGTSSVAVSCQSLASSNRSSDVNMKPFYNSRLEGARNTTGSLRNPSFMEEATDV